MDKVKQEYDWSIIDVKDVIIDLGRDRDLKEDKSG